MMKPGFCLLLQLFLQRSGAVPKPDTHIHVYVPPDSEGAPPNEVGGLTNQGPVQRPEAEIPPFKGNFQGAGTPHVRYPLGKDYQGVGQQGNQGAKQYKYRKPAKTEQSDSDESTESTDGPMDASKLLDPNNKYGCGKSAISPGLSPDYPQADQADEISGGRLAEPNVFPWMLRLCHYYRNEKGNREKTFTCDCGATLITSLHALTSFWCVHDWDNKESACEKTDLSNGDFFVIPGTNEVKQIGLSIDNYYKWNSTGLKLTVKDALFPKFAGHWNCDKHEGKGHDFAMLVFKERVVFSAKISPICLPLQDAGHGGQRAVAAGWGMHTKEINDNDKIIPWTMAQNPLLKRVNLMVTKTNHSNKMFGTLVEKKRGEYQGTCSGDDGGPLMYEDPDTERWVIIGTSGGGGYSCQFGEKEADEEYWNMVSAHTNWIKKTIKGEKAKSILELVMETPELKTLLKAVTVASLEDTLDEGGPFTVFAPTNDAFAKIPKRTLEFLLSDSHDTLEKVLLGHVVSGKGLTTDNIRKGATVLKTAAGWTIEVMRGKDVISSSSVTLDDPDPDTTTAPNITVRATSGDAARVVDPFYDVPATNGVVHLIDTVLGVPELPPA